MKNITEISLSTDVLFFQMTVERVSDVKTAED